VRENQCVHSLNEMSMSILGKESLFAQEKLSELVRGALF
jgi:hypothetical protein